MTMKTSSKKWQKIRKIKGLRQFVTWYPRHVSENPGYMPDQIFYTMEEVPDLEELVGKRVWYFQCFGHLLEESDKYTVTYENMGHYGFQYMDGNTDFDILKVNITEETGND